MSRSHNFPLDASDVRYQQLSQLIERYELGAVTHQQFERLKQGILRGEPVPQNLDAARIEFIVATYSEPDRLQESEDNLLSLPKPTQEAIIDAALLLKRASGAVRIRSIAGLTRPTEGAMPSVIVSLCSLLFPPETNQVDFTDVGWQESISFMSSHKVADAGLRRLGDSLPAGSHSLATVYWSTRADEIAVGFVGFDSFARRILSDPVLEALTALLNDASAP